MSQLEEERQAAQKKANNEPFKKLETLINFGALDTSRTKMSTSITTATFSVGNAKKRKLVATRAPLQLAAQHQWKWKEKLIEVPKKKREIVLRKPTEISIREKGNQPIPSTSSNDKIYEDIYNYAETTPPRQTEQGVHQWGTRQPPFDKSCSKNYNYLILFSGLTHEMIHTQRIRKQWVWIMLPCLGGAKKLLIYLKHLPLLQWRSF